MQGEATQFELFDKKEVELMAVRALSFLDSEGITVTLSLAERHPTSLPDLKHVLRQLATGSVILARPVYGNELNQQPAEADSEAK